MPRKQTKRKSRRGAGVLNWAKNAHNFMKARNGYSLGLSYAHDRWGKPMLEKTYGKQKAAMMNIGIKAGLTKLRQAGYGLKRTGNGLKRTGNGLKRTGNGLKRTGMGRRLKY